MRRWVLVVLAGCSGPAAPDASDRPLPVHPAVPSPPPASLPVTGMHGTAIAELAVTDDGSAVVSADERGGIRLWPALDGSREPIAIPAAPPRTLAIARAGQGFVIADQDAAAGAELISVAGSGAITERVMLAPEPAIRQLELTPAGALVLRDDQTIELIDARGVRHARLVPDGGTHVEALVVRGGGALAIVDDGAIHARTIELGAETAAWGATGPALPIDVHGPLVVSPDLRTLAARTSAGRTGRVALATGKVTTWGACGDDQLPRAAGGNAFASIVGAPEPLGFVDATTLVCRVDGKLDWFGVDGARIASPSAASVSLFGLPFAVADHQVVAGVGHQLALFAPDGPHYLGYAFRDLASVRASPAGLLIGRSDHQPLVLDAHLHERARLQLPAHDGAWTDVLPLDDRYVVTAATWPETADAWGPSYRVAVLDTVTHALHQTLPHRSHAAELAYEPATRLLVSSDRGATMLLRYDPASHTFGRGAEIASPMMIERVYLLDPALAGGLVALAVRTSGGGVRVLALHADDLDQARIAPRQDYTIAGELRAVDRAGGVYVQRAGDLHDVVIYERGVPGAVVHGIAPRIIRPSPDATRIATLGDARLELRTRTGAVVWSAAAWGATDVLWSADGELFARFDGALAKLDVATGAFSERQCGWELALATTPFETVNTPPVLCDVAP